MGITAPNAKTKVTGRMLQSITSTKDRFLRRLWLFENTELVVRELEFHRQNHDDENRDGFCLWKLDTETGLLKID